MIRAVALVIISVAVGACATPAAQRATGPAPQHIASGGDAAPAAIARVGDEVVWLDAAAGRLRAAPAAAGAARVVAMAATDGVAHVGGHLYWADGVKLWRAAHAGGAAYFWSWAAPVTDVQAGPLDAGRALAVDSAIYWLLWRADTTEVRRRSVQAATDTSQPRDDSVVIATVPGRATALAHDGGAFIVTVDDRVLRLASDGTAPATLASGGPRVTALAARDGVVWVAHADGVDEVRPDGRFERLRDTPRPVTALTADDTHIYWVDDRYDVWRIPR